MYYLIDGDGMEFEGKTLQELMDAAKGEAWYGEDSFEEAVKNDSFTIFKGTRIKVKVTPPKYEEIKPEANPKKPVKKMTTKSTSKIKRTT